MSNVRQSEESIFSEALAQPTPAARAAYLDAVCGDDADLRERLENLLKSHSAAGSFLGDSLSPTVQQPRAEATEGPGTLIGPYKLLQQIGEGGMGVVYMAEQETPVRRRVALKIIKPGMDTRQVIARFEAERQALAMMDHPNIARVLDAGTTHGGRPYFVMELVRGVPITEYCDRNQLPAKERLELLRIVCGAVQHAHQKGVIHRDLKPTNILVTLHDGRPVPKVIDFGIAKAISQRLTERTLFTAFGQMVGTPQYMSPEQAELSGLDVDTRSDIYSLGVLLYELLTGTTPFDAERLREIGYLEMQRIITEEDPPRPSVRLSTLGERLTIIAKHRSIDPDGLGRLIRGDLDWIVMKSLEKDRGRRYETASALAADLERHLRDEPVEACPPSAAYKLRKFVRRNRRTVVAVATMFSLLVLAVAGTSFGMLWARQEATRAAHEAMRAAKAEDVAKSRLDEVTKLAAKERDARVAAQTAQESLRQFLPGLRRAVELSDSLRLAAQSTAVLPDNPGRALLLALAAADRAPQRGIPHDQALLSALSECREERTLFAPPIAGEGARAGRTGFYMAHLTRDEKRLVAGAVRFTDPSEMIWDPTRMQSGYVYDLTSGQATATLEHPGMPFWLSDLSPDGKLLAAAIHHPIICRYADGRWHAYTNRVVRLWDTSTGKEVRILSGHEDLISSLSFSPDGRRLLASSWDATARVWGVDTGKELLVLNAPEEKVYETPPFPDYPTHWRASLAFAQFNADGTRILTIDKGHTSRHELDLRKHGFSGPIDYDKLVIDPPLPADKPVWMDTGGWGGGGPYWRGANVRLWDGQSGKLVATLPREQGWGQDFDAAFSPDGRHLVARHHGHSQLFDSRDGTKLEDSSGQGAAQWHATQRILALQDSPTLVVWQKPEGENAPWKWSRKRTQMRQPYGVTEGPPMFLCAGESAGRPRFAVAEGNNVVVKEFVADPSGMFDLSMPSSISTVAVLKGHDEPVTDAEFFPGGERLLSVSIDGTARTWKLGAERDHVVEIREPQLGYARFTPDGGLLTAGTRDPQFSNFDTGHVSRWDLATRNKIVFDRGGNPEPNSVDRARLGHLTDLDISPQGDRLVTVHHDGNPRDISVKEPTASPLFTPVRVWDARTGKLLYALEGFRRSVLSARFSPDGRQIVTFADGGDQHLYLKDGKPYGGSGGGTMYPRVDVWDSATGKHLRALVEEQELGGGDFALWSADSQRVFTNARPGKFAANIFDAVTGEVVCGLEPNGPGIDHAAYDPQGRFVVAFRNRFYDEREAVLLWDAQTGKFARKLAGHSGDITSVAFSPDGKLVLTTSSDQTARLWKLPGGEAALVLRGHEGRINQGAFSTDGRFVATASADGTARVWDVASGEVRYVIPSPKRAKVLRVEFSSDSAQLLAVSSDNTARVWTLDLLPIARRLAPRKLTKAERTRYQLP